MCAVGVALGFSSCTETWDDNPVLKTHEGVVTADFLNEPVMQDQPIMLTSDNADGTFHLTCSQPDYGYAAVASYQVQCSLTPDFARYEEISQVFYDCAEINPINSDVAAALEYLCDVKTEDDLPLDYHQLYMRVRAYVSQSPDDTQYLSNVVSFKSVSADYLAIWVADVPVNLYLRGGMNDWGAPEDDQFKTGAEQDTWVLKNVTIEAGVEFKISTSDWSGANLGADAVSVVTPGESFVLKNDGGSGNLHVEETFTGDIQLSLSKGVYSVILDPAH